MECTCNSDSDEDTFITKKPAQKNVTVEPREQIKGVLGIAPSFFFYQLQFENKHEYYPMDKIILCLVNI